MLSPLQKGLGREILIGRRREAENPVEGTVTLLESRTGNGRRQKRMRGIEKGSENGTRTATETEIAIEENGRRAMHKTGIDPKKQLARHVSALCVQREVFAVIWQADLSKHRHLVDDLQRVHRCLTDNVQIAHIVRQSWGFCRLLYFSYLY